MILLLLYSHSAIACFHPTHTLGPTNALGRVPPDTHARNKRHDVELSDTFQASAPYIFEEKKKTNPHVRQYTCRPEVVMRTQLRQLSERYRFPRTYSTGTPDENVTVHLPNDPTPRLTFRSRRKTPRTRRKPGVLSYSSFDANYHSTPYMPTNRVTHEHRCVQQGSRTWNHTNMAKARPYYCAT